MGFNIFEEMDNQILYKRKSGYSLNQILYYVTGAEPNLDNFLCLNHCVRVCFENKATFSLRQVKRIFNKTFKLEYHSNKTAAWNFIKKWCLKKVDPVSKVNYFKGGKNEISSVVSDIELKSVDKGEVPGGRYNGV